MECIIWKLFIKYAILTLMEFILTKEAYDLKQKRHLQITLTDVFVRGDRGVHTNLVSVDK